MNVKLVSKTESIVEGINSTEELVSYVARVSNPANQLNVETAPKLLAYCIRNKHWSIFDMADMTVEIKTSRAVSAQILRHKSFSFQEFSQRYAVATEFEDVELRAQGKTNRQVGEGTVKLPKRVAQRLASVNRRTLRLYNDLLKCGVAKECARFYLPLRTQTTIYMKGSLRSWITYFMVRCDGHTQKEHRDVANAIREIFNAQFPTIAEALKILEAPAEVVSTPASDSNVTSIIDPTLVTESKSSKKREIGTPVPVGHIDPNQLQLPFDVPTAPTNDVSQTAEAIQTK